MSYKGRFKCPQRFQYSCMWMNTAYIQQRDSRTGCLSLVKIGYYCATCGYFLPFKDVSGMV